MTSKTEAGGEARLPRHGGLQFTPDIRVELFGDQRPETRSLHQSSGSELQSDAERPQEQQTSDN